MGLPAPTQLVIDMSNFAQGNWYIMLGVIIGAVVGLKNTMQRNRGGWPSTSSC